jgi:hypothetical protein
MHTGKSYEFHEALATRRVRSMVVLAHCYLLVKASHITSVAQCLAITKHLNLAIDICNRSGVASAFGL